ncbi:MAG: hypothetical protein ACLR9W_00530 [Enterobacter hormaechei]
MLKVLPPRFLLRVFAGAIVALQTLPTRQKEERADADLLIVAAAPTPASRRKRYTRTGGTADWLVSPAVASMSPVTSVRSDPQDYLPKRAGVRHWHRGATSHIYRRDNQCAFNAPLPHCPTARGRYLHAPSSAFGANVTRHTVEAGGHLFGNPG